jgi:hypothetical protein
MYGVVGAPYITPRAAAVCKVAGLGFVDLAGNCRLAFGTVFVERSGASNPAPERRRLRALFSPRASRVVRVLLEKPGGPWQVQALAREAGVSLGLAFKVKQRLLDMEYARTEEGGVVLARPEELLRDWTGTYSFTKNEALDCFGTGNVDEMEAALAAYCTRKRIAYALTLFSGAARVAPVTRYSRGFAYAETDPLELATALRWKPVESGANFTILAPFDEGQLRGASKVNGQMVAGGIQLYLDLMGYRGRGEEAATAILERRLRPSWQRSTTTRQRQSRHASPCSSSWRT